MKKTRILFCRNRALKMLKRAHELNLPDCAIVYWAKSLTIYQLLWQEAFHGWGRKRRR